jgi:protein gp37
MSDKSHIEWTDATWNPVTGCSKVSAGCKHCYAERDWARLAANPQTRYYGRAFTDVQCHDDVLPLPLRWAKPRRIFVNSMADLFHPDVPDEFIADVFRTMAWAHQHTFQVLTKRPERMRRLLSDYEFQDAVTDNAHECADWPWPLANVWLGVSVEDQTTADERIPLLLQTPAVVRWISAEPLLGPISLDCWPVFGEDEKPFLHWVVGGGESGPLARPMHPAWARSLRDQCAAAGVPFLFKQWGEFRAGEEGQSPGDLRAEFGRVAESWPKDMPGVHTLFRVGKKSAGRLLDGIEHNGYPS